MATAYRYYRWTFLANAGSPNSFVGTREINVRAVPGVEQTPYPVCTTTAPDVVAGRDPVKAADGLYTTDGWSPGGTADLPAALVQDYGVPFVARELAVGGYFTATSTAVRSPGGWTLEGSNDGITWTLLDTRSGVVWTGHVFTTPKLFAVHHPAALTRWDGSAWVPQQITRWDGSAWTPQSLSPL